EWVHVQLHQQKGMISLSPPTICNSAQRAKAEESQQKLKAEQDKNKVLLQQLADRFKVERQAFIDAMVMTGVSRQDAEKRFLDYVKNKGRG
ncbi:hypothetical protein NXG20_28880, partial [Klebsiella pneumoniae]|nr:hypothetical protein [Klebsiella pneumoniae]MDS6993772.1 hypothetical protein [Klebsiella pneumoniae]MDS7010960.1 hypothetical protein [Klebsiella pneumoniae]MDS7050056.1 hypothetical protein [Klebsiella pneumoniae]MDS7149008.1 hypothetical protein [Klebsiella pneumoniae]